MTLATLKSIKISHTILKALGRGSWHYIKTASSQKKDLIIRKRVNIYIWYVAEICNIFLKMWVEIMDIPSWIFCYKTNVLNIFTLQPQLTRKCNAKFSSVYVSKYVNGKSVNVSWIKRYIWGTIFVLTKLLVFANFWPPQKCYNPLSPPVISRFISARLFSVPQGEN
jgi:hypothetical protein